MRGFLDDNVSTSVDGRLLHYQIFQQKYLIFKGYDEEGRRWRIYEAPLSEKRKARYDSFTVVGNEITIQSNLRSIC